MFPLPSDRVVALAAIFLNLVLLAYLLKDLSSHNRAWPVAPEARRMVSKPASLTRVPHLVYQCTEASQCQTWTDMQKGIVTAYVIAEMTNRRLAFRVTYPCENFADLVRDRSRHYEFDPGDQGSGKVKHVSVSTRQPDGVAGMLSVLDFDSVYSEEYLIVTVDDDYTDELRENAKYAERSVLLREEFDKATIYKHVMEDLFKPSIPILKPFQTVDGLGTCAHLVVGGNGSLLNLGNQPVQDLLAFLKDSTRDGYVYLSTDSKELAELAKAALPPKSLILKGHEHWRLLNIEGAICDSLEEDLFDQEVLKNCRCLVINHSDSGLIAAYLHRSGEEARLLCLADELRPCHSHSALSHFQARGQMDGVGWRSPRHGGPP